MLTVLSEKFKMYIDKNTFFVSPKQIKCTKLCLIRVVIYYYILSEDLSFTIQNFN